MKNFWCVLKIFLLVIGLTFFAESSYNIMNIRLENKKEMANADEYKTNPNIISKEKDGSIIKEGTDTYYKYILKTHNHRLKYENIGDDSENIFETNPDLTTKPYQSNKIPEITTYLINEKEKSNDSDIYFSGENFQEKKIGTQKLKSFDRINRDGLYNGLDIFDFKLMRKRRDVITDVSIKKNKKSNGNDIGITKIPIMIEEFFKPSICGLMSHYDQFKHNSSTEALTIESQFDKIKAELIEAFDFKNFDTKIEERGEYEEILEELRKLNNNLKLCYEQSFYFFKVKKNFKYSDHSYLLYNALKKYINAKNKKQNLHVRLNENVDDGETYGFLKRKGEFYFIKLNEQLDEYLSLFPRYENELSYNSTCNNKIRNISDEVKEKDGISEYENFKILTNMTHCNSENREYSLLYGKNTPLNMFDRSKINSEYKLEKQRPHNSPIVLGSNTSRSIISERSHQTTTNKIIINTIPSTSTTLSFIDVRFNRDPESDEDELLSSPNPNEVMTTSSEIYQKDTTEKTQKNDSNDLILTTTENILILSSETFTENHPENTTESNIIKNSLKPKNYREENESFEARKNTEGMVSNISMRLMVFLVILKEIVIRYFYN